MFDPDQYAVGTPSVNLHQDSETDPRALYEFTPQRHPHVHTGSATSIQSDGTVVLSGYGSTGDVFEENEEMGSTESLVDSLSNSKSISKSPKAQTPKSPKTSKKMRRSDSDRKKKLNDRAHNATPHGLPNLAMMQNRSSGSKYTASSRFVVCLFGTTKNASLHVTVDGVACSMLCVRTC